MTLIPEKVRIANLPKHFAPVFYNNAGASVAAGSATQMQIPGFGLTKTHQVKKVAIIRGLAPVQNVVTIAVNSDVSAGTAPNTKFYVEVDIRTTNREFRLARPEYEFGQTLVYQITINPSETADSVVTKLADTINSQAERERDFLIKAVADTVTDTVALTVQQPEGYSFFFRGTFIESVRFLDEYSQPIASFTSAPTFSITTPAHKGINYGSDVEFKEKLQCDNLGKPYVHQNQEVPVENELYTLLAWEIDINRPDPKSPNISDRTRFVYYVKESDATLESRIDSVVDFFLTNPATRLTSLEAGGVVVGFNDAEVITNTNAASDEATGQIDSDFAIATPISGTLAGTSTKYVELASVTIPDANTALFMATRVKENA